jgi:hypothetical protein
MNEVLTNPIYFANLMTDCLKFPKFAQIIRSFIEFMCNFAEKTEVQAFLMQVFNQSLGLVLPFKELIHRHHLNGVGLGKLFYKNPQGVLSLLQHGYYELQLAWFCAYKDMIARVINLLVNFNRVTSTSGIDLYWTHLAPYLNQVVDTG